MCVFYYLRVPLLISPKCEYNYHDWENRSFHAGKRGLGAHNVSSYKITRRANYMEKIKQNSLPKRLAIHDIYFVLLFVAYLVCSFSFIKQNVTP